jgi:hypothetical protein
MSFFPWFFFRPRRRFTAPTPARPVSLPPPISTHERDLALVRDAYLMGLDAAWGTARNQLSLAGFIAAVSYLDAIKTEFVARQRQALGGKMEEIPGRLGDPIHKVYWGDQQ